MNELIQYLDRLGYAEFCGCFNPAKPRLADWERTVSCVIDKSLGAFLDLLLLGKPTDKERFTNRELAMLRPFIESGVVDDRTSVVQTRNLVLYIVLGFWLFFERPAVDPTIYYGDDSFALLSRLRPLKGRRTLDLCSGPGAQAIHCSRIASSVTSVEINPFSSGLAQINRSINEINNWEIATGNLFDPLPAGATYDHIICNPPLLPFPDDEPYPFVGHGGQDGWKIIWEVLDSLPRRLSQTGHAQFIGATLSDGIAPGIVDRLRAWAADTHMDCRLFIVSHTALEKNSVYFNGLAYTSAVKGKSELADSQRKFEKFLEDACATHLASHYLFVTHGTGAVFVNDMYLEETSSHDLWFI